MRKQRSQGNFNYYKKPIRKSLLIFKKIIENIILKENVKMYIIDLSLNFNKNYLYDDYKNTNFSIYNDIFFDDPFHFLIKIPHISIFRDRIY